MHISVDVDVRGFVAGIKEFDRAHALAQAKALTFTAEAVRKAERAEMLRVLDRPTPYTLNSLYLKSARPDTLTARVWIKGADGAGFHYLKPQVFGGDRQQKLFESVFATIGIKAGRMTKNDFWIVPGSAARLDRYGNISRGQIRQLLSALGKAERTGGYSANRTKASAKRKGVALTQYFIGAPGGGKLPFGVWQRFGFASGSAVKPVLIFVKRPRYKARWNFETVARDTVDREWPAIYQRELKRVGNLLRLSK
jgi:hypothetical protein